ncbi:MAG: hypothetical protein RLZZ44_650 [Bacteroidota bacterium]
MKWKALLFVFTSVTTLAYSQKIDEEIAIKKLLEKESATWRSRDVEGHKACWHIRPYSRILVSKPDEQTQDVPLSSKQNINPENMGNGGFAIHSNIKMSITNNNAWVSHDEVATDADGKRSWSYEIRLLEKIKGQWKLVGQSIHIYKKE